VTATQTGLAEISRRCHCTDFSDDLLLKFGQRTLLQVSLSFWACRSGLGGPSKGSFGCRHHTSSARFEELWILGHFDSPESLSTSLWSLMGCPGVQGLAQDCLVQLLDDVITPAPRFLSAKFRHLDSPGSAQRFDGLLSLDSERCPCVQGFAKVFVVAF
jgi:hypothetical protein